MYGNYRKVWRLHAGLKSSWEMGGMQGRTKFKTESVLSLGPKVAVAVGEE